jgi:hypothetical protein
MSFNATSLFASGTGPVLESYDDILKYKGKNGWTEKRTFGNEVVDFCYDDEDDWTIPEEYRFLQSYALKESYMLPSPAVVSEEGEDQKYTYNANGTAAIKEMILNKRAVQIGFCADTSMPDQEDKDGIYISKNWAHYTYKDDEQADHAVTIVGWDDNYPRENFVEGHEPPEDMFPDGQRAGATGGGNGAWLVKNSWGSEEEEFPNKGPGWGIEKPDGKGGTIHTGYFWLSYYDKTLSMPEALAFDLINSGSDYIIDEYDFMPVSELLGVDVPEEMMMSNVFRAEECEELDKVSCETTYPNTTVINEVYILPDGYSDPTEGILVDRAEQTFEYGGFHTIDLETPDIIQKGQHYSIVQTQKIPVENGENYAINISMSTGKEILQNWDDAEKWVEGVINPGESFLFIDGKWHDYSDDETKDMLMGNYAHALMTFDNFAIKGYCTPKANLNIRIKGNQKMQIGDEITLAMVYKGDPGSSFIAPDIKWELAEGGDEIFDMTPVPDRTDKVTVKAKKTGESLLYVSAEGIGTTAVRISTVKREIVSVMIADDYYYTGKPVKPVLVVEDQYEEIIPASHYTVKFSNNIKCGEATAYVKIKGGDPVYEGDYDMSFHILPQKAVIKSLKAGKGRLTVTVRDQKASGVYRYNVWYRIKGKSKWSKKTFKASKGNKLVLKNLKKGKRYQVKVRGELKDEYSGKFSKIKTSSKIS